jgi:hypothetical protein
VSWIVRLRAQEGDILENASYGTPSAAMSAYRALLGRQELVGQHMAAVFKPPRGLVTQSNTSTWFSRFDRELGAGRIGPDDPRLDPYADETTAASVANTPLGPLPEPIDWEADPRPFAEVCKAWAKAVGSRDAAAHWLRVSRKTFDGWCDGRGASQEKMARRLMTLTDRLA